MDRQITPAVYSSQRILTTAQIAEYYETTEKIISQNFNRNPKNFVLGEDYFALEGKEKSDFLNHLHFEDGSKHAKTLYLWTEYGALMHAKSLQNDRALDVFRKLRKAYFIVQEQRVLTEQEIFNQNFHQRCVKNASKVPSGYFLIAVEMGKEAWSERAYHVELQYNRLPDGSAGQKWPNHLKRIGWDVDSRVKVWCDLPNGNEGNAWAYPEEYLLEFRRWMRNEYKDHFVNNYSPSRLLNNQKRIG